MQKLRGSARRPVELPSLSAQDEKLHWLRQPMQSAWSLRITVFSSGVTNTSVLSGVFKASTKPWPNHWRARIRSPLVTKYFLRPTPTQSPNRSEEHTSELQSLKRISYSLLSCQKKNNYK